MGLLHSHRSGLFKLNSALSVLQSFHELQYLVRKIKTFGKQVNSRQYHCFISCRPQFWVGLQKKERKKKKLQVECERN